MHVISVLLTIITQNSNTEVFTDTIPNKVLKNLNNTSYSIYLETHSCPAKLTKNGWNCRSSQCDELLMK